MDSVSLLSDMDGVNLKTKQKRTAGQKHGDLRIELLREGLALLDTQGVEGVTIRAVARNTGVAHSAPANHFPTKQALLTAIAAVVFANLADLTVKAITGLSDKPEQAIQAFAETCFQFAFDTPNRYQLLWQRQLIDQDDPVIAKEMERVYSALLSLLRQDHANHRVDIETDAIAIWSMIHGYISMRLDGNLVAAKDTVTNLPRHKAILLSLIDGIYHRDS
ncbi:TetR/AcrR family transcriptional regulator [Marinobacter maritimus]|uniref:TetR/AcrR family transcriptional regulator n=1 Tax=Marinobacter maritimus TaxID=277961 RepID=UPI0011A09909|nr:WHG domain-containing protein [Marinobacter maritimus]